jgi:hypothetical protein
VPVSFDIAVGGRRRLPSVRAEQAAVDAAARPVDRHSPGHHVLRLPHVCRQRVRLSRISRSAQVA